MYLKLPSPQKKLFHFLKFLYLRGSRKHRHLYFSLCPSIYNRGFVSYITNIVEKNKWYKAEPISRIKGSVGERAPWTSDFGRIDRLALDVRLRSEAEQRASALHSAEPQHRTEHRIKPSTLRSAARKIRPSHHRWSQRATCRTKPILRHCCQISLSNLNAVNSK